MLSRFSWDAFWVVAGVLACACYGILLGLAFRQRRVRRGQASSLPTGEEESPQRVLSYEELEQVASQLRHGILREAGRKTSKPQLLRQIRAILDSHSGLRAPASRGALHAFACQQARELCGITIDAQELEQENLPGDEASGPPSSDGAGGDTKRKFHF